MLITKNQSNILNGVIGLNINTEISIKPPPLGRGQLLCNCPEISGSETQNKPHISRMLENCILDDLQEIKFLEASVCSKTQRVSDLDKSTVCTNRDNLK